MSVLEVHGRNNSDINKDTISSKTKRAYKRRPSIEPVRYFLAVSKMGDLMKIFNEGVSVDISEGGLGMITPFSLRTGDVLFFDSDIKIKNNIVAKASIVRWVREIENNRFRVGVKFFAYIDKDKIA